MAKDLKAIKSKFEHDAILLQRLERIEAWMKEQTVRIHLQCGSPHPVDLAELLAQGDYDKVVRELRQLIEEALAIVSKHGMLYLEGAPPVPEVTEEEIKESKEKLPF